MSFRTEFKAFHLSDHGIEKSVAIGEIFSNALDALEKLVPPGRERALLVTKLQEAASWAKRGMAMDLVNQVVENWPAKHPEKP